MLKLDYTLMRICKEFASLSHCVSQKVACIAVKDGRIISTGINGTASGFVNCDSIFNEQDFNREDHHTFSETYEIHAEMNMVLYAAKNGIALNGATIYCTLHPCWQCVKNLSALGIKKIFYNEVYDRLTTEDIQAITSYCQKLNILIEQLKV